MLLMSLFELLFLLMIRWCVVFVIDAYYAVKDRLWYHQHPVEEDEEEIHG